MNIIWFYLYLILWLISVPIILASVIFSVIYIVKNKKISKNIVLPILINILFVSIFFGYITPDYSKTKIDSLTESRFLQLCLNDIDLSVFRKISDYYIYESKNTNDNSYITIGLFFGDFVSEEDKSSFAYHDDNFIHRIFGHRINNSEIFVFVKARESNRALFENIVPTSYNTFVRVVGADYWLHFSIGSNQGKVYDLKLLNQAIDEITKNNYRMVSVDNTRDGTMCSANE